MNPSLSPGMSARPCLPVPPVAAGQCLRAGLAALVLLLVRLSGSAQSDAAASARTQREARELADRIRSQTQPVQAGKASPAVPLVPVEPCNLLTRAEIGKRFAKIGPGRRDRTREAYGIVSCSWAHGGGSVGIDVTLEEPNSAEEGARGWIAGFTDPLRRDVEKSIRVERVKGVGDEAYAVIEVKDDKRGILGDTAYLVTQRGGRQLLLVAIDLARLDRATALATLAELGRTAIGRR